MNLVLKHPIELVFLKWTSESDTENGKSSFKIKFKMLNSHHSDDFSPLDFVDDILEFGVVGGCVCKRWTHGARCNDHVLRVYQARARGVKESRITLQPLLRIFWMLTFEFLTCSQFSHTHLNSQLSSLK